MGVGGVLIFLVPKGGEKTPPAYIEYFKVRKAIVGIAQTNSKATVGEVRQAFDRRAAIDDIDVIAGRDLEVTKEGNDIVISFAYPKRVSLFGNVSVVFDFASSSNN